MNSDQTGQDPFPGQEDDGSPHAAQISRLAECGGTLAETEAGMEALLRENEYAFRNLRRGETIEGTVVRVDQDEVLVDIGLKSEGIIQARELFGENDETEPLHIGDRALVYVIQPEGPEGHAILSLRRARTERSWREIEDLYHRGAIVDAQVVDFNKGGLIVDVKSVRGFVPVSQVLDLRNVSRQEGETEEVTQLLAAMKGRWLPLKIIEINRSRNRLILSERAAVQERRTQLKDELMDQLEPGQIRRGVVSNLTSFGAFVDLGGADGLVHVSELSYNRVSHPNEILHVGQEVDVYVLHVDRESKKIALSLKRAQPDPWSTVDQRYRVGEVVPAEITKLAKFGAFAKVEEGLEGLIHLSELTHLPVQDPAQVVQEGQQVDVKIIHINSQRRRLGLSVRQAVELPLEMESFGEVDEHAPFAAHDLASLAGNGTAGDETPSSPQSVDLLPPQPGPSVAGYVTGEQDSPAAESEPDARTHDADGFTAAPPEEASPALPEASLPRIEEEKPEVASAVRQGTTSD